MNTFGIADAARDIETRAQIEARFADATLHDGSNPFIGWSTVPVELRSDDLHDVVMDRSPMFC